MANGITLCSMKSIVTAKEPAKQQMEYQWNHNCKGTNDAAMMYHYGINSNCKGTTIISLAQH